MYIKVVLLLSFIWNTCCHICVTGTRGNKNKQDNKYYSCYNTTTCIPYKRQQKYHFYVQQVPY